MPVGQGALINALSYVAIGREVTYGTYVTGTAGINVLSANLKAYDELKILEEIQTSRTNSNSIRLSRVVEGELEFYFGPRNLASNYLLHNAFGGGPVTSATATGETVGGGGFSHTINIANFDVTYSSLSINMRKGDSASAKIFEYTGLRVGEFGFSAELDEPLVCSASLIGRDFSNSSNDVSASLSTLTQVPLSFVNGRFSAELTTGSLTSSSFWHVQSVELSISNNLQSDSSSRRIGSNLLQVLPPGLAQFELKATIRFDTTTAMDAMKNNTRFAAELEFLGDTMSGSVAREGIKITMPYVFVSDAGDPEIGGPGDFLTSEVVFAVLRDPTTSGYAIRAVVTNNTSSYA
ncbi:MAG TPA: phage tail tube protein [Gammaproteobacteria bacterium]|nr:phage tail tube protein [Gammaproteobacteria bacterium]